MKTLLRWELPQGGCLEVTGDMSTISAEDITDAAEILLLLSRQCERLRRDRLMGGQKFANHAADIPLEKIG